MSASTGMGDSGTAILGSEQHPVKVWYDPSTESISIICDDPRLTDESGRANGLRVTVNANGKSADYNPAVQNRLARYLRLAGKIAPADVPVKKRQLSMRPQVIAELASERSPKIGKAASPEAMGWSMCPACTAVVVDLDRHRAATSC
ncbi:hypothetical protein WY02_25895 [Pseudonocardia sp. AL041005-10]|nr:hypothetical protein [Pseudonocardia sp. AL041005-10]ALE81252.1 hypothetical protein WY02_25895 [Pseudonocardia sp. AL041005-10]